MSVELNRIVMTMPYTDSTDGAQTRNHGEVNVSICSQGYK